MATTRGCLGQVQVGASVVGELRTWELTEEADRIDASVMGACVRKYEVGPVSATGTFTVFLDDSDAGQSAMPVAGNVALTLWPGGAGSGKPQRAFSANVEQVAERADVDGLVERDYTYAATTAVDRTPQV